VDDPEAPSSRHRRLFLLLAVGLVLAGVTLFLTSLGVIHPSFDKGPRAPRWLGVCVSALLLMAGLGPLAELAWRSRRGPSRADSRTRTRWDTVLGLVFLLCLAAPANWLVYRNLKAASGLLAQGPLLGLLRALGTCALLVFAACLDAYLALLGVWLARSLLRGDRSGAELLGRRPG